MRDSGSRRRLPLANRTSLASTRPLSTPGSPAPLSPTSVRGRAVVGEGAWHAASGPHAYAVSTSGASLRCARFPSVLVLVGEPYGVIHLHPCAPVAVEFDLPWYSSGRGGTPANETRSETRYLARTSSSGTTSRRWNVAACRWMPHHTASGGRRCGSRPGRSHGHRSRADHTTVPPCVRHAMGIAGPGSCSPGGVPGLRMTEV